MRICALTSQKIRIFGQIRILKNISSNRTFESHLKCGFVRLHWFYRTERSDFTENSAQCERGLEIANLTNLTKRKRFDTERNPELQWVALEELAGGGRPLA